jgi:signal transduction histidine kinase/ActR/RegA family two-component response regulator
MSFAPGTGLAGRVWTSGRALTSADIGGDPGCVRRTLAAEAGLRSWIGFPVTLRAEVLGVIGFFSTQAEPAAEEILSMLTGLGSQLGQFIERQQLAEQFRQAQKMEAIGTLAGGIAHDFNNIIAAISGYTELAKLELGDAHPVVNHLDAVLTGSSRAASLVRQIMAFTRQQEHERHPIQLRHVVNEALNLLRASIPSSIDFDIDLDRDLPTVLADATQIHQVVMNLCTNAWHAMKDRPGKLTVRLELWTVDAEFAEIHPGLKCGRCVRLSISDTGHGMDQATQARIFEPFFTTKAPGEGTGLGLAVVHGVVQSHDGVVTVYSRPGEGTIFRIYLPATAVKATEVVSDGTLAPRGQGQRVLFVDDEEPLALMGQMVLVRLGYAVEACTDPKRALELVRTHPARYDLVITDLAMPGLTGTQLAQELLAIRGNLPIVLCTGFAATLTAGRINSIGVREVLLKPLSVQALGLAVSRVLSESKLR